MRKYGTSADQVILPEEGDVKKTASKEDKQEILAEVAQEQKQFDQEDK